MVLDVQMVYSYIMATIAHYLDSKPDNSTWFRNPKAIVSHLSLARTVFQ